MGANPYGRPQGGFLQDYSGIAGAGSAFEGFLQGMQSADDRAMKHQEMDAKMKSYQSQLDSASLEKALKLRAAGAQQNAQTGQLEDAPLSAKQQFEENSKLFGEGGMRDPNDPTKVVTDPNAPKTIAAKNSGLRTQLAETDKHNKDWEGFADKINNPSSRSQFGRYQLNVDKANTLKTFERTLGLQPGQQPPANETQAQRIARYNKANPQDLYEVAKAADQLLSNAQGSVYGTEHLMPKDMGIAASTIGQWLHNGAVPANSGAFIDKFMNMANREGKYYQSARDKAVSQFASGYKHLKSQDPQRWEEVLGGAGGSGTRFEDQTTQQPPNGLMPKGVVPTGMVQGAPPQSAAPAQAHPEANQALIWAKAHAQDPRAQEILKRFGQ
jgi:hypothetical protein